MKLRLILLVTLFSICHAGGQSEPGFAINFVVPATSSNVDGNTYSFRGPAINQPFTIRYQQVYKASEFAYLTNLAGGWLFDVVFRGDATNGTQVGLEMPSVQVNVSTTQRGPDQLSTVFSDNVGPDDTIVRAGKLVGNLIGGHGQGPEGWAFLIGFSKMFLYDPAGGNLLLDVRIFQGNTNGTLTILPVFDAVNVTNESVSRLLWGDVNTSTGVVDTVALPTKLYFWPNPKLHIQQQTNSLGLWWPVNPTSFVFQTTQNLLPQSQWQDITSGIVRSNAINTYKISLDSAGAAAYFRLISTTPP